MPAWANLSWALSTKLGSDSLILIRHSQRNLLTAYAAITSLCCIIIKTRRFGRSYRSSYHGDTCWSFWYGTKSSSTLSSRPTFSFNRVFDAPDKLRWMAVDVAAFRQAGWERTSYLCMAGLLIYEYCELTICLMLLYWLHEWQLSNLEMKWVPLLRTVFLETNCYSRWSIFG